MRQKSMSRLLTPLLTPNSLLYTDRYLLFKSFKLYRYLPAVNGDDSGSARFVIKGFANFERNKPSRRDAKHCRRLPTIHCGCHQPGVQFWWFRFNFGGWRWRRCIEDGHLERRVPDRRKRRNGRQFRSFCVRVLYCGMPNRYSFVWFNFDWCE